MCGRKHTILEWNVNILLIHNNLQLYILFPMYFSWTYAICCVKLLSLFAVAIGSCVYFFSKCDWEFPDLLAINPKGVRPLATSPPLPLQPKQKTWIWKAKSKQSKKVWCPHATHCYFIGFFIHSYIHRSSPFIIIAEQLSGRHLPGVPSRDSNSGPPFGEPTRRTANWATPLPKTNM